MLKIRLIAQLACQVWELITGGTVQTARTVTTQLATSADFSLVISTLKTDKPQTLVNVRLYPEKFTAEESMFYCN